MTDRHRLFFALLPDNRVRHEILRVADSLKLGHAPRGSWTAPERLHLTLHFLGDYPLLPKGTVEIALAAGDKIKMPRFDLRLVGAMNFPGEKPPWILRCAEPCAPLHAFLGLLGTALTSAGFRSSLESDFVPHVTLLRHADKPLEPTAISPIDWSARDFVLMHSRVGQQREYSILHRWMLSDCDQ